MNFQAGPGSTSAQLEIEPAALEQLGRKPRFYSISASPLTFVTPVATADSSDWSISAGKRFLDVVVALLALVLLSPVFLIVALLVAFSSSGPIMFEQKRVGRLGQLFTIYKFRSMYPASQHWGPTHTRCGDARVTRVGKVLRKYKLDELPQFYNVLRGDMSLVGPRPKIAQHEGLHMPFRPGLTGAATLAFRCEEEMLRNVPESDLEFYYAQTIKPLKTQLDSSYMERATLLSDAVMLLRTAAACILPRRYHPLLRINSPKLDIFDLESLDVAITGS